MSKLHAVLLSINLFNTGRSTRVEQREALWTLLVGCDIFIPVPGDLDLYASKSFCGLQTGERSESRLSTTGSDGKANKN